MGLAVQMYLFSLKVCVLFKTIFTEFERYILGHKIFEPPDFQGHSFLRWLAFGIRVFNAFLMFFPVFLIFVIVSLYAYMAQPILKGQTSSVVLVIPSHYTLAQTLQLLFQNKITKNQVFIEYLIKIAGAEKNIKSGTYIFHPSENLYVSINKIIQGRVQYKKAVIREGLSNYQVLLYLWELAKKNDIIFDVDHVPEYYLYPDTYFFESTTTKASELIATMKEKGVLVLDKVWEENLHTKPKIIKNKSELLILASIVQKESGHRDDPRLIASVFINRLENGMRLQSDPTAIFAYTEGTNILPDGKVLPKFLKIQSPYNTYIVYGLPPSQISNPGLNMLLAVMDYADTDHFFFVSNGKGGHNFAKTYKEHNDNIKILRDLINQKNLDRGLYKD